MPPHYLPSLAHTRLRSVARFVLAALYVVAAVPPSSAQAPTARQAANQTILNLPLHFEPTSKGNYVSRIGHHAVEIGSGGQVHVSANDHDSIGISLAGAASSRPTGESQLPGHTNYLLGHNADQWRRLVPQYERTHVNSVYPGIDLVYYGNGHELEHDYIVAPGADAHTIAFSIDHATPRLDSASGDLILQSGNAEAIRLRKPVAYQIRADGSRQTIASAYEPRPNSQYGFALGTYDHSLALTIDPVILYSSYFGGKYNDSIVDIKVASDGSLYLLLTTDSTDLKTIGTTAGACIGKCGPANPDLGNSTQPDMYLAKLDSTAQTLLFATYLGGSDNDQAYNLALDTDGSIYVSGASHSTDFPIVNGYPGGAPVAGGSPAGTLTKLSADGSTILYSTFIGYGKPSVSYSPPVMVTANNGIVYLIGQSGAANLGFIWQKNPLFKLGVDFLAKLDTTRTGTDSVIYATYVGDGIDSTNSAQLASLALDSKGNVWLYGQTKDTTFPVTTANALEPQCRSTPCIASFLMEIDPTGTTSPYATYLGGTNGASDVVITPRDIVIDPADNIYVSGYTNQGDFPTLKGVYLAIDGYYAGYASKLSPDGKTLLYSTFLPASAEIAVSTGGQLAFTSVAGSGFPLKNNLQTTPPAGNNYDAAFGLIDTTQSFDASLLISSYLGTNTGYTQPQRAYLASSGQILITGETSATDLPATNAYQSARGGGTYDGFLTIIQPSSSLTATPSTLTFPSTSVGSTSAAMTATLYNGTTSSVYLTPPTLTDSTDFTQSDNCNGILAPLTSCTVTFLFTPKSTGALVSTYSIANLNNTSVSVTIALNGNATPAAKANTVTPNFLNFGNVAYRTRATLPVTFTNNGTATVTLQPYTVSDSSIFAADFNGTCSNNPVVPAGGSCTYDVIFIPEANQSYSGTFTVVDGITNPVVTLAGVGLSPTGGTGALIINPSPVNVANIPVGQQGFGYYTLTNSTSQTITLLSTSTTSTTNDMSAGGGGCFAATNVQRTPTLAPGGSCSDYIIYEPNAADEHAQGTLNFTYQVQGSQTTTSVSFPITGNGLSDAVLGVSPTTLQFPATPAGKTSAQTVTVSNSGESPLAFNSANITSGNAKNFTQTNTCGTAVAGKSSCIVTVTFAPDTSMTEFTANLDIQTSIPRPNTNQTDTTDTIVQLNGGTNPADFVVSSNSGPSSYNPYTATWTINVAPLDPSVPWNQPVTFAMTSGPGSAYGVPVFTPASVTPGNSTVSTTMTLTDPRSSPTARGLELTKKLPVLACGMLCLFCLRKRFKGARLLVLVAAMSLAALSMTACSNPPVNIVVTATSGSVSHTVTVVFQP